jgi:arsenate reductase
MLKTKLPFMDDDEIYNLLASDGMLVKRPLLILDDKILIGFKVKEWDQVFKNED